MENFNVNPNVNKPKFTIGILMYHRTQELVDMARICTWSVNKYKHDAEVIIVDNGSTVRYDWDKECDKYVRLNKMMGISHGWNEIIRLSRGQYINILGDDTEVREGWLDAMEEGMQMPNAGICSPYVEHLPEGTGIVETYKWPSGACFMMDRETIRKVGLFDEDTYFPANHEDWDYWVRVYKAGLKIYRNYRITVRHKEGQTVHAKDISSKNNVTRQAFLNKWHFDPTPIFCGNGVMPFS